VAPKTNELVTICEQLAPQKAEALVDFVRLLQHQATSESAGDKQWERIVADPQSRPKLDAFAAQALHEGDSVPLDPDAK